MKHQSDEPQNEGGPPRDLDLGRLLWGLLYDLRLIAVSAQVCQFLWVTCVKTPHLKTPFLWVTCVKTPNS